MLGQCRIIRSNCRHHYAVVETNNFKTIRVLSQKMDAILSPKKNDKINPSIGEILDFLTRLHDESLSYSVINTVKSVVFSV